MVAAATSITTYLENVEDDIILNAGEPFEITWSSYHGSGLVDIYLVNWLENVLDGLRKAGIMAVLKKKWFGEPKWVDQLK